MNTPSFRDLAERLAQEGLLDPAADTSLRMAVEDRFRDVGANPWYIRAMVGFGAWVSAILVVAGLLIAGFIRSDISQVITGIIFISGAVMARKASEGVFAGQLALAVSLSGHATILLGMSGLLKDSQTTAYAGLALGLVVPLFYPDTVHRFLSAALASGSLAGVLHASGIHYPYEIALTASALSGVFLLSRERGPLEGILLKIARPMGYGFTLSAATFLLLGLHPGWSMRIYFSPWVAFVLGALIAALAWKALIGTGEKILGLVPTVTGTIGLVLVCWVTRHTPGIIGSIGLLAFGFYRRDGILTIAGIILAALFIPSYYYYLAVTLLEKSVILSLLGVALLAGWKALGAPQGDRS